ncbi:shikimate kinase [Paraglaciecola sp. 20A4]|uniref:shikimate kinase n=1 Tax=Paraglaciecola sp. 20A4 TaxID=2687288 RepID=UPI0014073613|nr:shikimate kinase [Paraglaciecola sp. 20A4]
MKKQIDTPKRIVIFGNSGSGKSTLAQRIGKKFNIGHLDLDTVAWLPTEIPERATISDSMYNVNAFIDTQQGWVIEGCYADLLENIIGQANLLIFTDLPVEACIENARHRSWEPHKYPSEEAQNANLSMLVDWIIHYYTRTDTFSYAAHNMLFNEYQGTKKRIIKNPVDLALLHVEI